MICERCQGLVREPSAVMGSTWLYACACGKNTIRPAQQFRGTVLEAGHHAPRRVIACAGVITEKESP